MLLDEDVPRPLKRELVGHAVSTAVEMGWARSKNGALLALAVSAGFEVLVTADRNMPHQQNVPALGLALIVLAVPNTRMRTIFPLVAEILVALDRHPQPGTLTFVGTWRVS